MPQVAVIASGITELLGAENALVPCAFVAETINVLATPFVNPFTVMACVTLEPLTGTTTSGTKWPFDAVALRTVKLVGGVPPPLKKDMNAWLSPAAAVTPIGVPGTVGADGVVETA